MSRLAFVLLPWLVLLALTLAPRHGVAQSAADVELARELFREGSAFAKKDDWEQARDRYQRSLEIKRAAITLYSLGIAQQNTERLVEALESLRAFLAEPRTKSTQAYEQPARDAIAAIEPRVARVSIHIAPEGLEELKVTVDGQTVPTVALGRPRLCNPGTHELLASAAGHEQASAEFTVGEGEATDARLSLVPLATKPPPPPPTGSDGPELTAPIVLLAAGGAVLITGVAVGLAGVSQASDAAYHDDDDADGARSKAVAGDVLAAVGGAAAGVGLILLVVQLASSDEPVPEREARLRPWGAGGAVGVEVLF